MIILDTHIWLWWSQDPKSLTQAQANTITDNEKDEIGVSAISLWEVAKLVEYNRIQLPLVIDKWFQLALSYPSIQVIPLSSEIVIESTQLPDPFHRDPADQLIVATARIYNCPLITSDRQILRYFHVETIH